MSTFGAILDGWAVGANSRPPSLAPMIGVDGGPPTGTGVTIDVLDGSPVAGSAQLMIPFSGPAQELLFAQASSGLNLAGTTVTAQIKLVSGLYTNPADVGRAYLVLKSTAAYIYVAGPAITLDPSAGWVGLSINVNAPTATVPPGYDACEIREIDVVIDTGVTGAYAPAVVLIDTISIAAP